MLARRDELIAAHPKITQAAELAPLMGEHEREYWDWQLERYLEQGPAYPLQESEDHLTRTDHP